MGVEDEFVIPRKADYRQRAHCNPLSDSLIPYPITPRHTPWHLYYPRLNTGNDYTTDIISLNTNMFPQSYDKLYAGNPANVTILDIGCGYGSLLVTLADLFPDKYILGMEIREKVTNFTGQLIHSLRRKHNYQKYMNVYVVRTNAMRYLPNYICSRQLEKIFFCYPDPHFKKSNWRRRIINASLLSLYAYLLKPKGVIYIVTDVLELFEWMVDSCDKHELFVKANDDFLRTDHCYCRLQFLTDEGKKFDRMGIPSYKAAYTRI
ncbi:tRNA (guanine-N7-)-methyltransferase [Babesia microti strain RI]|uniref:tRNA (guanine-N(7)-)-methyltransferase n=1 Tax=Babesia microti (strain RI) TaxID=1133968 RepID=A0A1R4AA73_BABMR|nr:tRNA (guanine-N7-)-methyltransferase [Babesia microti strain RI]SJK85884.1 tRNA (guanine-N7-)-methyltransferase [Babesia microti strain RI]|eukprot:XP_021338095.1 tRNA (guanine-N7-)-methyltransferase [Babesia microti strain RI]